MEYVLCSPAGSPPPPEDRALLPLPPPPPLGSSRPERLADRLEALARPAAAGTRRCYRKSRRGSASPGASTPPRETEDAPPLPPPPPLGSSRPELALVRLGGDDARPAAAAGSARRSASPGAAGAGAGGGQRRRRRRSPTRSSSPSPAPPKRSRRGSYWKCGRREGRSSHACSRSRSPGSDRPHSGYGATINGQDNTERLGLMTYKQFTQVLEDDVSPGEAGCRYQEYRTEYITTQKRAYFDLNKNEDWLKDMYHPTKLLSVIERRNDFCKTLAKNLILDLRDGTLDLGPGLNADAVIKSGDGNDGRSENDAYCGEKKRKYGRGPRKEIEPLSAAPKAHPVSSQYRRISTDIDRTLALVKKLDSEKDIVGNILLTSDNDKSNVDKSYNRSMGPVVIVRGLNTVKGLEGVELLDTLLTYLWRVHGVDYYGMSEMKYAKGFRHVRSENKSGSMAENINAADWEKKLDSFWEERLMNGEDPLVVLTAKDQIDAAIVEVLEAYVRKMRDKKYVWKYGCGAKGCEKLFHSPEYVHKHLRLKHPDVVSILTSGVENDIYFQNYMNDPDAPGGKPVMQQMIPDRMKQSPDEQMHRASGGHGSDAPLLSSKCAPPLVLIPVPGAGPYGPFVPAPPDIAVQMMQKGLPGPDAAQHRKPSVLGPMLPIYPSFPLGKHTYRSYKDLDAPDEEIAALDLRRL